MLHKSFDMPLNVVVILRFDKNRVPKSHKSRAVLFSTDLEADHKTIIDIYHVRYQIEFNFRDARQFFGLSNFKNIKKQQVQNVIGYAFFMVTLSNILLFEIKHKYPESKFSIQDLKAYFRAEKYLNELLNKDEFTTSLFLNLKQNINLPIIGAINPF
jgi:putative transposase